jgi:hypothetical protein
MIDKLRNPKVQGALRHLLTAIGPLLAAKGYTDDVMWQLGVGLVMAALGFWASLTAPEKAK